ncbi:MAG: glutamate formimidoyltransferase, partial [Bacteroidota bacterium]
WDDRWKEFSDVAEKGMQIQKELLRLVDEDTAAFNRIMEAFGLPKNSEEEKAARANAIEMASQYAMEIPLKTAKVALEGMDICMSMVKTGNPNSITDAGVGALCIRTAVLGAVMNVRINAAGIKDKTFTGRLLNEAGILEKKAEEMELEVRNLVKLEIEK